ncbi:MAG: lipoyl(octanoyl) transferase LipB [Bacteroidales bacterium]|nr:lipoyl(octanoyl) transferase LipB [Bacteroidales bacterium]
MTEVKLINLGLIEYKKAWDFQESLFNEIIEAKKNKHRHNNYLIICEHPHVYTIGKSGNKNNLLINSDQLDEKNISFYHTNRGGDITYHGPGQLVGYPVLDLNIFNIGLKEYVNRIEETIIQTLKDFNLDSSRRLNATGVWINPDHPVQAKKICAIGVRSSKYVTMHGFALNINTDLKYYEFINPCGFNKNMVTSMKSELDSNINFKQVITKIIFHFQKLFNVHVI